MADPYVQADRSGSAGADSVRRGRARQPAVRRPQAQAVRDYAVCQPAGRASWRGGRRRLRRSQGTCKASWVPVPKIEVQYADGAVGQGARDLLLAQEISGGTVAYLRERLGINEIEIGCRRQILIRRPDEEESRFFGLPVGVPADRNQMMISQRPSKRWPDVAGRSPTGGDAIQRCGVRSHTRGWARRPTESRACPHARCSSRRRRRHRA
jgi:hypothetical protein